MELSFAIPISISPTAGRFFSGTPDIIFCSRPFFKRIMISISTHRNLDQLPWLGYFPFASGSFLVYPVPGDWLPPFLEVPIPLPHGTSDYSRETLEAIRELYFVLCVVEFVLQHYFDEPEIAHLLGAYFSDEHRVQTVRVQLQTLIFAMNREYTMTDKPGRYGRSTDDNFEPWGFGSLFKFSTTRPLLNSSSLKRDTDAIAEYSTGNRLTIIFCDTLKHHVYKRSITEVIHVIRKAAGPMDIDGINCLTWTVLHEMAHEHLEADDFGRYRFNESIEYVRQRSRDKHRPVHADGLSMFILRVYLTVRMPRLDFCNLRTGMIGTRNELAQGSKSINDIQERLVQDPDLGNLKLRFNIL